MSGNALSIHRKGGIIELHINNQMVRATKYCSHSDRTRLIDRWRMEYPPNQNQERVLIIKPDWDNYNHKND